MWNYDKLYKKNLLFLPNNINENFNLFNTNSDESFFNYYSEDEKSVENIDYIIDLFSKDFNIKFLYKINLSNKFFFSINKFFDFNLIDFYNYKNQLESYKNVMAINSVYEYRFANSSFKSMNEFILTIFKTFLENFIYFDDLYKNINYSIVLNVYEEVKKNYFFKDIYNINNINNKKTYLYFLKSTNRLFNICIYFFKFNYLLNLIEDEKRENLLRIDVFSRFYDIFENKQLFYLLKKIEKKKFYKK
jgi:hypothetical protein